MDLLNPGENGWVTAEVTRGEYKFYCSCDIANVNVNLCIIQNDSPAPSGKQKGRLSPPFLLVSVWFRPPGVMRSGSVSGT